MGRWGDFLRQEAVPMVEKKFGCGGLGHRGLFGKSSGGYGAIVHALLHNDFWSAAASHSSKNDVSGKTWMPSNGGAAHISAADASAARVAICEKTRELNLECVQ